LYKFQKNKKTKQKVFLLFVGDESYIVENDPIIISLPHPKRNTFAKFIVFNDKLLEIQRMIEDPSSWFIDNTVQQDGSLYIASPIDPLFLLINLLEENRRKTESHEGYFCELTQILSHSKCTGFLQLNNIYKDVDLSLICDIRDGNEPLYRLNDEKLIQWLRCKVKKLIEKIEVSPSIIPAAQAVTFRSKEKKLTKEEILHFSLGLISEYIDSKTLENLSSSFGITNNISNSLNSKDFIQSIDPNEKKSQTEKIEKQKN